MTLGNIEKTEIYNSYAHLGGVIKTQIPFTQLSPRHLDGKNMEAEPVFKFLLR